MAQSLLERSAHAFTHPKEMKDMMTERPVFTVSSLGALLLIAVGLFMIMPSLKRYIRISTM